ncbi:hypothetical protein [Bartonella australis]|uniref:hypothetical protein n=1 Tax=Bartonella australis TaxID=388640 RepID=UPI001FCAFAF1|nr:hypothetical protein [Bartonella australis]
MKKYFLMITILLAPLFTTACEKTYSKEEFKKTKHCSMNGWQNAEWGEPPKTVKTQDLLFKK